jgi:hypothetical protein
MEETAAEVATGRVDTTARRSGHSTPSSATSPMFDAIRRAQGQPLDRAAYRADAAGLRASGEVSGDVWKLERSQTFYESGDPAWEAFLAGDWDRVLAVFGGERDDIRAEVETYRRQGLRLRRLRVVEKPLTPYLQWEMHSHRIFVECGFDIRVIDADRIRRFETCGPVPELMIYGGRVLYQVRYDHRWAPAGAKRVDDPDLARSAADTIAGLYAEAEPFADFFAREVAARPPVHTGP